MTNLQNGKAENLNEYKMRFMTCVNLTGDQRKITRLKGHFKTIRLAESL